MKLIIGLGNPGAEYAGTRHNIGFYFADKLRKIWDLPEFEFNKKLNAEISKNSDNVLIVKPQTFMNLSGDAVRAILDFYKLTPDDVIVIHDDLDITIGNYKISKNVSSAGHNGIDNIIEKIGTQDFTRVRVGVEMEAGRLARQIPGEDFVLQKFSEEELEKIKKIITGIISEIKKIVTSE